MKVTILIILMSFLVSGCYNAPDKVKPMSWLFNQMPKDAPTKYKQGWKDGCESGMSSMTNTFFKTFYSFKQNKELLKDPTYYKTWKDTYTFCRHYVYGTIRQGNQRLNLPNSTSQFQATFMGAEGILETGMLQMLGPGDTLKPLSNFGSLGGNGSEGFGMGGSSILDFSGDTGFGGSHGMGMTMDFSDGSLSISK